MAKCLAILFAVIYLLPTTVLSEVLKLPLFVEHYAEYQGDLTDFLVHHYGGHEKDADWETDQKLPFMDLNPTMNFVFDLPKADIFVPRPEFFITPKGVTDLYKKDFTNDYLTEIFRPPQIS